MCAADKCNAYGNSWTCPPACGTIEECQARMMEYEYAAVLRDQIIELRGIKNAQKKGK